LREDGLRGDGLRGDEEGGTSAICVVDRFHGSFRRRLSRRDHILLTAGLRGFVCESFPNCDSSYDRTMYHFKYGRLMRYDTRAGGVSAHHIFTDIAGLTMLILIPTRYEGQAPCIKICVPNRGLWISPIWIGFSYLCHNGWRYHPLCLTIASTDPYMIALNSVDVMALLAPYQAIAARLEPIRVTYHT
jgi:hypothetical protein